MPSVLLPVDSEQRHPYRGSLPGEWKTHIGIVADANVTWGLGPSMTSTRPMLHRLCYSSLSQSFRLCNGTTSLHPHHHVVKVVEILSTGQYLLLHTKGPEHKSKSIPLFTNHCEFQGDGGGAFIQGGVFVSAGSWAPVGPSLKPHWRWVCNSLLRCASSRF